MLVIGLTGGSGAGKSTVARMLSDYGGALCDADALYASMTCAPSAVTAAVSRVFGSSVLAADGSLNRTALGAVVFSDPEKLALLNRTVHPLILEKAAEYAAFCRAEKKPYLIFDAPQLFESGADRMCSFTVAVLAPEQLRAKRIAARDGLSEEAALRRIRAQLPDSFFLSHCDYILENTGDAALLRGACDRLMLRFGLIRRGRTE